MAETTTATSWPASTSRLTWRATLRMRSISATDVPPNFITRRAITSVRSLQRSRRRRGQREKARIHTGGVRRLQPDPVFRFPGEGSLVLDELLHVHRLGEAAEYVAVFIDGDAF